MTYKRGVSYNYLSEFMEGTPKWPFEGEKGWTKNHVMG